MGPPAPAGSRRGNECLSRRQQPISERFREAQQGVTYCRARFAGGRCDSARTRSCDELTRYGATLQWKPDPVNELVAKASRERDLKITVAVYIGGGHTWRIGGLCSFHSPAPFHDADG